MSRRWLCGARSAPPLYWSQQWYHGFTEDSSRRRNSSTARQRWTQCQQKRHTIRDQVFTCFHSISQLFRRQSQSVTHYSIVYLSDHKSIVNSDWFTHSSHNIEENNWLFVAFEWVCESLIKSVMNSSAMMSAQCQPIDKNDHQNYEKSESKNRNRVRHQSAWSYISNRIMGAINKTFKKGNSNSIAILVFEADSGAGNCWQPSLWSWASNRSQKIRLLFEGSQTISRICLEFFSRNYSLAENAILKMQIKFRASALRSKSDALSYSNWVLRSASRLNWSDKVKSRPEWKSAYKKEYAAQCVCVWTFR